MAAESTITVTQATDEKGNPKVWSAGQTDALKAIVAMLSSIRKFGIPGIYYPQKLGRGAADLARKAFGDRGDDEAAHERAANLATAYVLEKRLTSMYRDGEFELAATVLIEIARPPEFYRGDKPNEIPSQTRILLLLTEAYMYFGSTILVWIDNGKASEAKVVGDIAADLGGALPPGHVEYERFSPGVFMAQDQRTAGAFRWVFGVDFSGPPEEWKRPPPPQREGGHRREDITQPPFDVEPDINNLNYVPGEQGISPALTVAGPEGTHGRVVVKITPIRNGVPDVEGGSDFSTEYTITSAATPTGTPGEYEVAVLDLGVSYQPQPGEVVLMDTYIEKLYPDGRVEYKHFRTMFTPQP